MIASQNLYFLELIVIRLLDDDPRSAGPDIASVATDDERNVGLAQIEKYAQIDLPHSMKIEVSNAVDFGVRVSGSGVSFAIWRLKTKILKGMVMIFVWRYVFKVFNAIVATVSIFVIDDQSWRAWAYKCGGYQSMHKRMRVYAAPRQYGSPISIVHAVGENVCSVAMKRLNAPNIRHLVHTIKSVNWSPNFFHVWPRIVSKNHTRVGG